MPGPHTPVGGRTSGPYAVALLSPHPQATRTPTMRLFRDRRTKPQESLRKMYLTPLVSLGGMWIGRELHGREDLSWGFPSISLKYFWQ